MANYDYSTHSGADIDVLEGHTIRAVEVAEDYVVSFITDAGVLTMHHIQDCCEHVRLEDVAGGELSDLVGQKVVEAYESGRTENDAGCCHQTWTFYTIRTNLVTLVLRWLGESNGYYSEAVDLYWEPANG